MKNLLSLIVITLVLSGCAKKYIQVFETKSTNTEKQADFFVYETDTLKITYSFWAEKGVLSFAVYNKLDQPIYIDWKKSSFIDNSNKLNYWVDEERSNSIKYFGSYFYDGPLLKTGYSISESIGISSASKIKIERITFIPPKSNYYRSQFYLLPVHSYKFGLNTPDSTVQRNDKPKKETIIYSKDFQKKNSPLTFRNFLTFSLSEEFKNEFFIDNNFYLSNMKEMDYRHFKYLKRDEKNMWVKNENGYYIYERPFKKSTSFYLYVPNNATIKYRKDFKLP
jgi:hypothetical protein